MCKEGSVDGCVKKGVESKDNKKEWKIKIIRKMKENAINAGLLDLQEK